MSNDTVGVYSVLDLKTHLYDVPFFSMRDELASRRFVLDIRNKDANPFLSAFKDDFELWRIATWNRETGEFEYVSEILLRGKDVEV